MASQIWRITGLDLQGRDLVASGLGLTQAGVRVESGATLTSSFAPSSGNLSALLDGDAQTSCTFSAADVATPGFYIEATLTSGCAIDGLVLSGASLPRRASVTPVSQEEGFTAWAEFPAGEAWFRRNSRKLTDAQSINPSGMWLLNESGVAQTDIAGTRTATRTGGAIVAAQLTLDGALAFDPQTSGKVVVPNITAVDAGSFSVVVDIQTATTDNLVVIEHGSDNLGWSMQTWSTAANPAFPIGTGCLLIPVGGASVDDLYVTTRPINDGKPHRIVFTFDSLNEGRIYVDGRLDTFRPGTNARFRRPIYNTTYLSIGSRDGIAGLPIGSLIGNVAIFNRVLSAVEINRLNGETPAPDVGVAANFVPISSSPSDQGLKHAPLLSAKRLVDIEQDGSGRIHGTVERTNLLANVPLVRRVRLHRSRDGMLVRETWSGVDGSYEFTEISDRYEYDVIAWDHEMSFRSVVANNLAPEVMP